MIIDPGLRELCRTQQILDLVIKLGYYSLSELIRVEREQFVEDVYQQSGDPRKGGIMTRQQADEVVQQVADYLPEYPKTAEPLAKPRQRKRKSRS
jgi:protoheme ferro-lyase